MNELDLFTAALAVTNSKERKAFLDRECAGNLALRERLVKLVEAHLQSHPLLDQPVPGGLGKTHAFIPSEQPGAVIAGRYKLLEEIGEGGMGTVWVAEQTEPVRRKVALKLIKAGMDSKSVLARFEAERQALAVMDHPNIAKVLDGGLTDTGRPYFVMEYVKGVPITEYCDATRLSVQQRLNLFVQVCQAVQHAHQKGIIHRDLKPSNILVAPYDDLPVPKVIDFGLAKAMHQSLTEKTLHTAHETVLGTPLYMSPEQAQLNNIDVDTRSDIYSLGVLLYELLTGTTPLEKQRFKEAAWDEVKRIIREEEPPRPSMRISSTTTLPSLAAGRQIEPARLTKLVRGELDWIVMKSLEKDRSRRYETASGFAADLQRYLDGEPVLAAPPSARYLLSKFARKHRAGLTTAAAIGLLLVAGVAVSTWQAIRATRAEADARQAEQAALVAQRAETERAKGERLAKLDAEAKRAEAERQKIRAEAGEKLASERLVQVDAEKRNAVAEKQIAQAVLDFLQNKLLRQADVKIQADTLLRTGGLAAVTEAKANPTILELLDRAAKELTPDKIDANFPKQPLVQASILLTVGATYRGVGENEQAIGFLERSVALWRQQLGPDDSSTLTAMDNFAQAYRGARKLDLALPLIEETLKLRKAKSGPDHPATLAAMASLASAYQDARKLDLALPLFEETLQLTKAKRGPNHPSTFTSMNNLAVAYLAAKKLDLALPLFEETLQLTKAKLGPNHPSTFAGMHNLAGAYQAAGKLDLALPLFEETLELTKAKLGHEHPNTLNTMSSLADAYRAAKMPDLAAALHAEVVERRKAKLGADHADTLASLNRLAHAYRDAKKLDLALSLYEEALQLVEGKLGHDHLDTLTAMNNLAGAYRAAGKLDLSIPLYEELLKLRKAKLGPEHPDTLGTMWTLAMAYGGGSGWNGGASFDRAIPLLEELWKIRKQNLPEGDKTWIDTQSWLGLNLLLAGRFAEAEPHLLASFRDSGSAKDIPKNWREAYALRLIGLYVEWDKPAQVAHWQAELNNLGGPTETWLHTTSVQMLEASRFRAAELLLRDCLAQREKAMPDSWKTFSTKSLLGGALLGQKKYADAEPLLLAGYAGMKQRETTIGPRDKVRLTEAVTWIVQLYVALDKKDEAAKWSQDSGKMSLSRYDDIVRILQAKLGPDHPDTIALMSSLAWGYRDRGDFDHAVLSFEQLWKKGKQNLPEGDKIRIDTQHQLGLTLVFAGRFAEAEPHLLASYRDGVSAKDFPKDWPQAYALRLVGLYAEWGKAAEEAKWAAQWQADLNHLDGRTEWQSAIGLQMLQAARFRAAEPLIRDCLAVREKTQPDVWTTFNAKSMLGGALLGQKKYADAEPLLLAGFEGLNQREEKIPANSKARLHEAVDRLIELYNATNKPDEVKKWQGERAKYPQPSPPQESK